MNLRLLFPGALALLLGACSLAPTPSAPQPTVPGNATVPAPIYEVTLQGVGDATPRATAHPADAQGVGAQALVAAPETLTFQSVSTSSYTDTARHVRHLQASFRVTNPTTSTFRNLMFVPVGLNDTDGDADNNAMLPTIAGTPFRRVGLFDGSDASSRATDLAPTYASRLDPATGEVLFDPSGSTYRTRLNVSQVVVPAPDGLTVDVKTYGWKVTPVLAPGQSATVTFAVDLANSDPGQPAADPYTFSLMFVPVQDDPVLAATGSPVSSTAVAGTLNDSALFGGQVNLRPAGAYIQPPTFTATVGAAGEVALPVSTVPPANDFVPVIPSGDDFGGCTYSGTFSDSAARIALYGSLTALSRQGDPVGSVQETIVSGGKYDTSIVGRVYARKPLELRGDVLCFGSYVYYDVSLAAGWNTVDLRQSGSSVYVRTLADDARSVLQVIRSAPGVTATLDDTSVMYLKPGDRVQRNATLLQVGAYSGTVHLSTNVAGVSVEPATLNLAPLGTQSIVGTRIGTQSLSTALTFVGAADMPARPNGTGSDALILSDDSGKELSRVNLIVAVQVPGVYPYLNDYYSPLTLAQGGTAAVGFGLSVVNGFRGPLTLSLADLPEGVTASPITLDITSDSSVYASFQLVASSSAAVGNSTMTLITTPAKLSQNQGGLTGSSARRSLTVISSR